jgi:hypothetical protein
VGCLHIELITVLASFSFWCGGSHGPEIGMSFLISLQSILMSILMIAVRVCSFSHDSSGTLTSGLTMSESKAKYIILVLPPWQKSRVSAP